MKKNNSILHCLIANTFVHNLCNTSEGPQFFLAYHCIQVLIAPDQKYSSSRVQKEETCS